MRDHPRFLEVKVNIFPHGKRLFCKKENVNLEYYPLSQLNTESHSTVFPINGLSYESVQFKLSAFVILLNRSLHVLFITHLDNHKCFNLRVRG